MGATIMLFQIPQSEKTASLRSSGFHSPIPTHLEIPEILVQMLFRVMLEIIRKEWEWFVWLSVCLSVCMSVCLSVWFPVCNGYHDVSSLRYGFS